MLSQAEISQRAYLVGDLASVKAGMRAMEFLIARRAITRHCAEEVLAQCAEDLGQLTSRLLRLDALIRSTAVHNV